MVIPEGKSVLARLFRLPVDEAEGRLPVGETVGVTGYREAIGDKDLFSVVIEWIDDPDESENLQRVNIYALAPEMQERLPEQGSTFILTDGFTPIARCEVLG